MPINIRNGIYIMLCNILYMKVDKIVFFVFWQTSIGNNYVDIIKVER